MWGWAISIVKAHIWEMVISKMTLMTGQYGIWMALSCQKTLISTRSFSTAIRCNGLSHIRCKYPELAPQPTDLTGHAHPPILRSWVSSCPVWKACFPERNCNLHITATGQWYACSGPALPETHQSKVAWTLQFFAATACAFYTSNALCWATWSCVFRSDEEKSTVKTQTATC